MLYQPYIQPTANKRTMAPFLKDHIRGEGKSGQLNYISGCERECPLLFDMKHLHDGNIVGFAAVDECLETIDKYSYVAIMPVRSMAEGFLRINHQDRRIGSGHLMPPV